MKLCAPDKIPQKGFNSYSIAYTIIPFSLIILTAALYQDIVYVIKISGGIFGVCIMTLFPSLFVIECR
jgi:hypothetical protein